MSAPARVVAGVPTGGQFASQAHAEADITLDPQLDDAERQRVAAFYDLIDSVDAYDVQWTEDGRDYRLADMGNGRISGGQCYPATRAFAAALAATGEDPGAAVQVLFDDGACHYANTATVDGHIYVIDWTFSQFAPYAEGDTPFVATVDEWQHALTDVAGEEFGDARSISHGTVDSFADDWAALSERLAALGHRS